MPNIGPLEIIVVLVLALVVLGPRRLPEFGRSIGKGMREFTGAVTGRDDQDRSEERVAQRRCCVEEGRDRSVPPLHPRVPRFGSVRA